jgi:hypothetical protein
LTSGGTTLEVAEGGTLSTDRLMVCPQGDITSTGVDVGSRIDLVAIFLEEDEREDVS